MKQSPKPAVYYFRLLLAITGLLSLVALTYLYPLSAFHFIVGLVLAIFIALLYNLPIPLLGSDVNLIHILTALAGLLYGPVLAGWAVVTGVAAGYLFRKVAVKHISYRLYTPPSARYDTIMVLGHELLPLMMVFSLPAWNSGLINVGSIEAFTFNIFLLPVLLFEALHCLVIIIDFYLRPHTQISSLRQDLSLLILQAYLPVPFILVAGVSVHQGNLAGWVFVPSVILILAGVLHGFSTVRSDLYRRFQELATLNQISSVLQSTLDLENLLTVLQVQVSQLLDVNNFYVALYDHNEERIWYPLAVKHGQRQYWSPRSLLPDRLTDRVIRDGKPVLLTPHTEDDLPRVGLPMSEETPYAWMGVPLVNPDRITGCLAVFSLIPEAEFTQADLNLLTIISGQVSVTIENALLYEQTQRRAAQLETLNRISSLMSASLDQEDVLAQVCRSVTEVGGAQHSAIFLLDPEKGLVFLAHTYNLSSRFSSQNETFPITQNGRMRCLRTGRPVLTPALDLSPMKLDYFDSLEEEGIQAFGEFPLSTPDGQIGFLAVYFDAPHTFRAEDEDLLGTFASQAALAVSNARLYSHVDTALSRRAYQLSILETVGRELSAAISSERLFETILDYALEFTNSQWGELSLYNTELRMLEVKAARGYSVNRTQYSLKEGLAGRAIATHQAINLGDVRGDPNYIDLTGGEALSSLCIPLNHEGRVLGVLTLQSQRLNAYTLNDQAFINQLAAQAGIAVVNAELYNETQRRLREQSILYLVSTRLIGNPDLENVIQTLARSIETSLPIHWVGIYLWEEDEQAYQRRCAVSTDPDHECSIPAVFPFADLQTLHSSLAKTGALRLTSKRGQELMGECRECQALVFPMISHKQRLGLVLIHLSKNQNVREEELQLLRAIVAQSSITLQNARLFSDVSQGRDRLSAIVNSVGEGILMMENSGRIVLANEFIKVITGIPSEEIINHNMATLPESALRAIGYTSEQAENLISNLGHGQAGAPHKTTLKLETKPERFIERQTSPVRGQNGSMIGWMIVLRDVTEEHQISQARELISGTLIHDLRSPVSAVLSAIDIVQETLEDNARDEMIDQALKVAHNSAMRVLGLIESLLDIARMQSGRMDLNLVAINTHQLVNACLAEFVPQASEYNVMLCNAVPTNLPHLYADYSKLTRVITNLLDNAIKFTPAGGRIEVSGRVNPDQTLLMAISDTGPGIPDEYREKIFDRFTQIPGQQARRRGSGLGLTFCRMAVEAHDGKIWADARQAPETGSIFHLCLPLGGPLHSRN